jgi:hypothetical protein
MGLPRPPIPTALLTTPVNYDSDLHNRPLDSHPSVIPA